MASKSFEQVHTIQDELLRIANQIAGSAPGMTPLERHRLRLWLRDPNRVRSWAMTIEGALQDDDAEAT